MLNDSLDEGLTHHEPLTEEVQTNETLSYYCKECEEPTCACDWADEIQAKLAVTGHKKGRLLKSARMRIQAALHRERVKKQKKTTRALAQARRDTEAYRNHNATAA